MTKQIIPNATLQDTETALFQEFGKHRARQLVRTPTQIQWIILLAPRIRGKATLVQTDTGVSVQLENYWATSTWVILIVCYCLCILPGIVNTIQLMIASGFAARIIPDRVKNIAAATQRLAAAREGLVPGEPPPPPPLSPPAPPTPPEAQQIINDARPKASPDDNASDDDEEEQLV